MPDLDHPSALSGALGKPFPEQLAFFRGKLGNLVPTQRWDDMVGEAHDTGFMVAGAMQADLLTDLAAAVDKAIAEGRGLEEFRKDFRAIVARNGWTGWAGEGSVAGEAWRVKTILRTNAYTSYSAGRHAQLLDGDYAFWVYRHGDSREPRLQHLGWNGLILPPGHEFWITRYPPSDWGCSCYVVGASSERAAVRLGGILGKTLPANWKARDPKTGQPFGVGKGWGYAPGASVAETVSALAGKIGSFDYQVGKAFLQSLPASSADALGNAYRALQSTADDARRYAQRVFDPNPDLPELPLQRTLGLVPSDQARTLEELIGRSVAGYDFSMDSSAIAHVRNAHGDAAAEQLRGQGAVSADTFALLPQILSAPDEIALSGTSGMNEQVLDYRKTIDGRIYTASLVARGARRRTLALKTLFVRLAGK